MRILGARRQGFRATTSDTDGGEDTMPRRDPIQAAADFGRLPGIVFHIIGFDVNQEDWNAQLREMAIRAGGKYWSAPKGNDLTHALRAALLGDPEWFSVFNSARKEVYRGRFGQRPASLPAARTDRLQHVGGGHDGRDQRRGQPFELGPDRQPTSAEGAGRRARPVPSHARDASRLRPAGPFRTRRRELATAV